MVASYGALSLLNRLVQICVIKISRTKICLLGRFTRRDGPTPENDPIGLPLLVVVIRVKDTRSQL